MYDMKRNNLHFISIALLVLVICSCKERSVNNTLQNANDVSTKECATPEGKEHSQDKDIAHITERMIAFRKSLSPELLSQGSTCLNNKRFYLWHNTPANSRGKRDGITYGVLSDNQLEAFKNILQLFLSEDGYQKVDEITVLSEGWLSEIKSDTWNPSFYSIDMFGDPEKSGSWGFQLDGHHCVVNFLVNGDKVSIVPAFLGGEPAKETFKGQAFDIFKDERDLALTLHNAMSSSEKEKAITTSSTRSLQVGPANRPGDPDPYIGSYDYSKFEKGLKFSEMTETTQQNILLVMKEYVYNLDQKFADEWWSDINSNIEETYFVWIDNVAVPDQTSLFYYRIYNPYLWVEFNTENVTGANKNTMAAWNHIHTITRIPDNPKNGGDYGPFATAINKNGPKTLLEHYLVANHHKKNDVMFDYQIQQQHNH